MRGAFPVATRLLRSLRGDRRTIVFVLFVPVFIVYLLAEAFPQATRFSPVILGVIVFFLTYVLTAIGFLRERTSGTLERVLVTPVSRSGLVLGYVIGFGVLATAQSLVLLGAGIYFLEVSFENGLLLFFLVELLGAFSALGIGVLLSLFASNEFQVMQFVPAVISPQVILGGTFSPVSELPWFLEYPARAMPVTYLLDGMRYVVHGQGSAGGFWEAVGVLATFVLVTLVVATMVVRRAG